MRDAHPKEAMPTMDFLPSIRDSETITCLRCHTRQFPRNGTCVRCHQALGLEYLMVPIGDHPKQLARSIGFLLRNLRNRRRMCQSQLSALAAGMNRSYLSKAECGHVLLPLSKLLPLARALGVTAVILRFEVTGTGQDGKSNSIR